MTLLPIVERELRVRARQPATYRLRIVTVLVALTVSGGLVWRSGQFLVAPAVGSTIFQALQALAFLYCLFEGARSASDSLSEEKREGTLGLLFLTDLKGYDVVLGKFVGTSLNSFYGLLAFLPVMAVPVLMGGVTGGEVWRGALALTNLLFFSQAAGIWVSARSRDGRKALIATLGLVGSIVVLPLALPILASVSPGNSFRLAADADYGLNPSGFWLSLFVPQLLAWWLLAAAGRIVANAWQDEPPARVTRRWRERWRQWSLGDPVTRRAWRTALLVENPVAWLMARHHGRHFLLWILLATLTASGLLFWQLGWLRQGVGWQIILLGFFVNQVLKVWVATHACHGFIEARRNGAIELLLTSPLTDGDIINGQFLALKRLILRPVALIMGFQTVFVLGLLHFTTASHRANTLAVAGLFLAIHAMFLLVDLLALIRVGMWLGMTESKWNVAVSKTLLHVMLLPWFALVVPLFGVFFWLGLPLYKQFWAERKLRAEFRPVAAHIPGLKAKSSGWLDAPSYFASPPGRV